MEKHKRLGQTIVTALCIVLMFFGGYFPSVGGLDSLEMHVAGIFIGTMLLWLCVSTGWPSVLCIVALILSPLYTYQQVLSVSIGGWIASFVLFSSMVAYALGQTGYLRRIAVWFITRPVAKRSPWLFLGLFFMGPLVIGAFMSPIPAFMVFIPIAEQIFKELGYEKGERLPEMVILSLLAFASISTLTTPIAHTVPILGFSLYEKDTGLAIDFVSFTVFGVLTAAVMYLGIMLFLKVVFRPDLSKFRNLDIDALRKDITPMSTQEKYTLGVFMTVVALWMLPGIIKPLLPGVAGFINALGTPTPPMIGVVVLCLLRVDGKPLMDFNEAITKGVPWVAVMMVAATMVLGNALTHEKVGITKIVVQNLAPFIGGLSPRAFVAIVALLAVLFTNFSSNTVTVTLIYSVTMPLVLGGAIQGVNPAALTSVIGASACVAMATPPSTAHAAIAAGTGWLGTRTMFNHGMMISLICALVLAFVGYPIAAALM